MTLSIFPFQVNGRTVTREDVKRLAEQMRKESLSWRQTMTEAELKEIEACVRDDMPALIAEEATTSLPLIADAILKLIAEVRRLRAVSATLEPLFSTREREARMRAAERERCAKVVEVLLACEGSPCEHTTHAIAAALRALKDV